MTEDRILLREILASGGRKWKVRDITHDGDNLAAAVTSIRSAWRHPFNFSASMARAVRQNRFQSADASHCGRDASPA